MDPGNLSLHGNRGSCYRQNDTFRNGELMILGLDVGGTQTDAVLIDGKDIVAEAKTLTGHDLLETLRLALDKTVGDPGVNRIDRMAFSTTMATNAIVQDSLEDAGMILSAGPGMAPDWFSVGPCFQVVEGCMDHQGFEALPLNKQSVMEASSRIQRQGIEVIGVVGKFSVRNPAHELQISEWVQGSFPHIAMGHLASGALNFPRRITTTYLNAALHGINERFSNALISTLHEKGLNSPSYVLKPDGGTLELRYAKDSPVKTAQSGPAASVMGALALDGCEGTCLVLDIGGTTTDMSIVLDGVPLLDPQGIRLGPYLTLIRSLLTHSIGVGGDSELRLEDSGAIQIGPLRRGRPVALGGPVATPTDAMISLGLLKAGNRDHARASMEELGSRLAWDAAETARRVLESMAEAIANSAESFIDEINSRPVYTIHEVLEHEKVQPAAAIIIGGPAPFVADYVGKALGLPCRVPPHFGVANAVGAAVARVTSEVTLQADTHRGTVVIPEANILEPIDDGFNLDTAFSLAHEVLKEQALKIGANPEALDISVTEQQVFNMIRGYSRAGQNIRMNMCITPGLIPEWRRS
jgi:N-methylhydantoinase A